MLVLARSSREGSRRNPRAGSNLILIDNTRKPNTERVEDDRQRNLAEVTIGDSLSGLQQCLFGRPHSSSRTKRLRLRASDRVECGASDLISVMTSPAIANALGVVGSIGGRYEQTPR